MKRGPTGSEKRTKVPVVTLIRGGLDFCREAQYPSLPMKCKIFVYFKEGKAV